MVWHGQATSHYRNQWWPDQRVAYASRSSNKVSYKCQYFRMPSGVVDIKSRALNPSKIEQNGRYLTDDIL